MNRRHYPVLHGTELSQSASPPVPCSCFSVPGQPLNGLSLWKLSFEAGKPSVRTFLNVCVASCVFLQNGAVHGPCAGTAGQVSLAGKVAFGRQIPCTAILCRRAQGKVPQAWIKIHLGNAGSHGSGPVGTPGGFSRNSVV
jgi:hypothetical protein